MNRIIKHKSIISFILVFLLSFFIVTDYKQKEAEAFDFVITPTIFFMLVAGVLGTGAVIANKDQLDILMDEMATSVVPELGFIDHDKEFKMDMANAVPHILNAIKKVNELKGTEIEIKNVVGENVSTTGEVSMDLSNTYVGRFIYTQSNGHTYYRLGGPYIQVPSNAYYIGYIFTDGNVNVGNNKTSIDVSKQGQYTFPSIDYYTSTDMSPGFYGVSYQSTSRFKDLSSIRPVSVSFWDANDNLLNGLSISADMPNTKRKMNESIDGYDDVRTYTNELSISNDRTLADVLEWQNSISYPLTYENAFESTGVLDSVKDGTDTDTDNPSVPGVWDWLKSLLNAILDAIKAIGTFLASIVKALLDGLMSLLKALFVPSDTFISDKVMELKSNFGSKLPYEQYTSIFNSNYDEEGIRDLMINWNGQQIVIVRFTLYNRFREVANFLIYAFMFFLLAIYNYSQIYKLIRGSNYVSATNTIGEFKGQFFGGGEVKK